MTHAYTLTGVNQAGDATGTAAAGDGELRGILLADGNLTVLPDLPGTTNEIAVDVNAAGQVVGWTNEAEGDAFLYQDGQYQLLPKLPGAVSANAGRITDDGLIVGSSGERPVVWVNGQPVALPMSAGASAGALKSVNEVGQAVGYVLYPPGSALAFQTVIWNLRDAAIVSLGEQLSAAVAAGLLSEGSARSLESKLEAAEAAMGRGNATAAANILRAFRQHVVAQSGKHIPASLAQGLASASALALATID